MFPSAAGQSSALPVTLSRVSHRGNSGSCPVSRSPGIAASSESSSKAGWKRWTLRLRREPRPARHEAPMERVPRASVPGGRRRRETFRDNSAARVAGPGRICLLEHLCRVYCTYINCIIMKNMILGVFALLKDLERQIWLGSIGSGPGKGTSGFSGPSGGDEGLGSGSGAGKGSGGLRGSLGTRNSSPAVMGKHSRPPVAEPVPAEEFGLLMLVIGRGPIDIS